MPGDVKDISFLNLVAELFLHYFLIFKYGFDVYVLTMQYMYSKDKNIKLVIYAAGIVQIRKNQA